MLLSAHLRCLILLLIPFCYCVATDGRQRRILPTTIEIREGEDVQVHLTNTVDEETSCYVKTPKGIRCNLKVQNDEPDAICNERIKYWSINNYCGIQITNVHKTDSGWWRLTSTNSQNKRIVDAVEIKVLDKYNTTEADVSIISGLKYTLAFREVDKFCLVQGPHGQDQSIVKDKCSVQLTSASADSGTWNAVVGINGQIEEVIKEKNVHVFKEQLHSGHEFSNNALHLFCNLKAHEKKLNFCRFSRSSLTFANETGLRLRDGMRKGRYAYYGSGLTNGECGLTIESPEANDYGEWYCMIGLEAGNPMQAVIQVERRSKRDIPIGTSPQVSSTTQLITSLSQEFVLECSASIPLSYCWFSTPDGHYLKTPNNSIAHTPVYQEGERSMYSYSYFNDELNIGKCGIKIMNAESKHNGTWVCHMGPTTFGIELIQHIAVRIADTPLAAKHKNLTIQKDNSRISLNCLTVARPMALQYCRFYSANGFGIHINDKITEERPITYQNVKYWYSGRGLNTGDCGLVIGNANSEHAGQWTCAARLEVQDKDEELFDTIEITYMAESSIASLTASAASGIAVGVVAILIVMGVTIGMLTKKYGHWSPLRTLLHPMQRNNANNEESSRVYLSSITTESPRSSTGSNITSSTTTTNSD
ncbi:hypothetical protein KM043_009538 [Ampulex compressa]|nr:hypothetical protein KM043_009538 [Ampulex compressa]